MGEYNWRLEIKVGCLCRKMTQVNIFEEPGGMVHRPPKNLKDVMRDGKIATTTRSIIDMFSAQLGKNQSQDERALSAPSTPIF